MNKFTYKFHDSKDYNITTIVFECEEVSILEADKAYQKNIGHDPAKNKNIGCSITFNIDKV